MWVFDIEAMAQAVEAKKEKVGKSWRQISASKQVPIKILTSIRNRKNIDTNSIGIICDWLDISPKSFWRKRKCRSLRGF